MTHNTQLQILTPMIDEAKKHFGRRKFTWMHDGASSHSAEETQDWLSKNVPDFIQLKNRKRASKYADEWPPTSPDLSPLDYCVNSLLKSRSKQSAHKDLESLKRALIEEWRKFPQEQLQRAIDDFPKRLKKCIKAKGGRFEE